MQLRRAALVAGLVIVLVLALSSGAGARGGSQKYKLQLTSAVVSCPTCSSVGPVARHFDALAITVNSHLLCRPFVTAFIQGSNNFINCFGRYPPGTKVVLKPLSDPHFTFTGWGGDCAGQPTDKCVLIMDGNKAFSAFWDFND